MKLTKTKLKQIIKEELSGVWWTNMTEDLLKKAQDMYRQAPPEGKQYMTKNFEMYAQKWREEQQAGSEEEELYESFAGLDSSKRHVFKKLKSGHWGKVYRPEGESQEGDLVIKPNTKGFPYNDAEERQDFLSSMAKD